MKNTDGDGNIYIADWRNDRTQKFTKDGAFVMAFGSSGSRQELPLPDY